MAVLPAEIPTGLITGQYYFVNEDNIDADTKPELTVVTGTVTFTCSVKTLRMPSKKAVLVPLRFDAEFDSQGNLKPVNGTGVGIELPATNSPLLTEQDYTWKVEFNLKEVATDFTVNLDSFDIQVPVDSTQDLSVLMPVASSPGTITIQGGPQGIQGEQGPTGKTPNIKVGTVVTGTPNPGPAGVKGDKGDPGGIVASSSLGAVDLNTVTTPGLYFQMVPSAIAGNNYPPNAGTGNLTVMKSAGSNHVIQTYEVPFTSAGMPFFWKRTIVNSVVSPWRTFASTRVDQTAGRAIYQWDEINNREQLVYGDTGLRTITSSLTYGSASAIYVRRNGWEVEVIFIAYIRPATDTTPREILTLPHGFKPTNGMPIHPLFQSNGVSMMVDISGSTGLLTSPSYPAAGTYYGRIKFMTGDTWPTTLPGSASGTIPNL